MHIPTFQDVLHARRQIRPYLKPTPTYSYHPYGMIVRDVKGRGHMADAIDWIRQSSLSPELQEAAIALVPSIPI